MSDLEKALEKTHAVWRILADHDDEPDAQVEAEWVYEIVENAARRFANLTSPETIEKAVRQFACDIVMGEHNMDELDDDDQAEASEIVDEWMKHWRKTGGAVLRSVEEDT